MSTCIQCGANRPKRGACPFCGPRGSQHVKSSDDTERNGRRCSRCERFECVCDVKCQECGHSPCACALGWRRA